MPEPRLFINYRTSDTASAAAALAKGLKRQFDRRCIFIDYLGIQGGEPWPRRLLGELEQATVLFALIGKDWLQSVDPATQERRLDRAEDWVRQEIEHALRRGTKVVPVLVDGATAPEAFQLPASLRPFAELQTRSFRTKIAFESDLKRLVTLLQEEGFPREMHPWHVSADSVYNRVELPYFVGRHWLSARLDEFLRSHSCGYFVVEAQSGLGKTAFLAHLVETRGYINHFVELQPGADGIVPGLRNLAAQVVKQFGLEQAWIDDLLTGIGTRADFLERLLVMAASQRRASDSPAVFVIDGLDQAGVPEGQNVLGLPARLPEGFFFVVSQRPVEIRLRIDSPREVVRIDATDSLNVHDIAEYVSKWLPVGPTASELVERSLGNWVYVYHLCREIREGVRNPDDLAGLPRGLWQYYAWFWMQWRRKHDERWTTSHLPLLCTVSAAQERLTLAGLSELAEVEDPASYRLLTSDWRPFVTVTFDNDGEHFELYHASLRDFFSGSVSLVALQSDEQAFASELRAATRLRHRRIAGLCLRQWGGFTLDGLRHEGGVGHRDTYGWRNVVAHLIQGEDEEGLEKLLKAEWKFVEEIPNLLPGWAGRLRDWLARGKIKSLEVPRNAWFESHARTGDLALFLLDWDRVAQVAPGRGADRPFSASQMLLEIAAYLVKSSVRDAALRIPPGLVMVLVRCDRWSFDQAIAYARHVADGALRAELLTELATVDAASQPALMREAIDAIDGLEKPAMRVIALTRLLEKDLPDRAAVIGRVLDALRRLDTPARIEHAPALVPYLTESAWPAYLSLVDSLPTPLHRLRMLTMSAAKTQHASHLQDRLTEARRDSERQLEASGHEDQGARSLILAIFATLTRGDEAASYADQALASAETALRTPDPALAEEPYEAMAVIASAFPQRIPGELLAATLERLLAIRQPRESPHDVFLSAAGVTLIEQHRSKLAAKVIAIAPRRTLRTIEKAVLRTKVRFGDWDAYQNLAIRYAQVGEPRRAIAVTRRIELESLRQRTLTSIAPYLDESVLRRALSVADAARTRLFRRKIYESPRHFEAEQSRATLTAMVGLLPRLAELGHEGEVLERLRVLRAASDEPQWPQILSGLARHVSKEALNELLRMTMSFRDLELGAVEVIELAPYLAAEEVRALIPASRAIGYSENTMERISWTRVQRSTSGIRDLRLRRSAVHAIAIRLAALGHDQEALREIAVFLLGARNGRSSTDAADCLGEIARLMRPDSWVQTLRVAAIHNDQMRPRALQAIASTLPAEAIEGALVVARSAAEEGCRAWGIACLLPLVDEQRRTSLGREAWELLHAPFWDRPRVLGLLAPHVDEALAELRDHVCNAQDHALISLTEFLPLASGSQAEQLIALAVEAYDDGSLLELAEFLPEATFRDILDRVIETTPQALYRHDTRLASTSRRLLSLKETKRAFLCALEIRNRSLRVRVTRQAAAALEQLPREELLTLWRLASPVSRAATRAEAFAFASALAPLVFALGGAEAIRGLRSAMNEASRWWY